MSNNNEEEKREGTPPILGKPGASFKKISTFGRSPAFSRAAGSIMDRIKNLSQKDLAFVAVGLGVLITAPVAEYMMSKPAGTDLLTGGFGSRTEAGGSLYEPGINSLSQGSPDGTGEVVTPLSSRDPASLIMGSQPSQPAEMPPQQPAPKTDFRDSMKESARNAFSEASKSAGVPTVIPRMQSSLRGMGSFFSGGEGTRTTGSLGGDKILSNAKNASGKANPRSMVGPVGGAGYKGASSSPNSANRASLDKLRAQANKAASNFDGDSSIRSLDKAAADSVDIGKSLGGMSGRDGEKYANPTGSNINDKRSLGGETLEQAAAKFKQQKQQEWDEYLKHGILKEITSAMVSGFTGSLGKFIGGVADDLTGQTPGPAPTSYCWSPKIKPNSTDTNDCLKGVLRTPLFKDKDNKITWNPNFSCICGIGGAPDIGPDAAAAEAEETATGAEASNVSLALPSTVPDGYAETMKNYDQALTDMAFNARNGEKASDPKILLKYVKALGDSLYKCSSLAQVVYKDVNAKTPALVNAEKVPYHTAILTAETKLAGVRNKYDAFIGKVTSEIGKYESGAKTAKVGEIEVVNTGDGVTPVAVLKAVKAEAEDYQNGSIVVAENKLKFHKKAEVFYDAQSVLITGKAGNMVNEVSKTNGKVAELVKLEGITPDTAVLPDNVAKIKETFARITGLKDSIPAAPAAANPAQTVPAAPKTAVTDEADPYMSAAISWRGADADKLLNNNKVDDSGVKKTESEYWAPLSPFKRLESRKIDGELSPAGEIGSDYVTLSIRGIEALPYDIKSANGLTAEIMEGMDQLDSKIAGWKAQLKDIGVSLDTAPAAVKPADVAVAGGV